MVADIDPYVTDITESWTNKDIVDAELALTGYVMFKKDRRERRGGGVILYIKESIQVYEITLKKEADCEEAIWCNIVTRNSTLTIGVVYRSPNIRHCFLTQNVLEPTRGGNVLDLILSSQNELVDNVKIYEPLGSSDHNQIHFNIKVKTGNTYKNSGGGTSTKYLLKNKTATECWTCLKYEIEGITERFVPLRKQGKRNTCQKRLLEKSLTNRCCGVV